MAKLEQGLLKSRPKSESTSSSATTTSTVRVENEKFQKPIEDIEPTESVRKKHHHKHCQKHRHHQNKSRSCSACHHHHHHCHHNHHHHNHKTKAKRREELLKEIKEGKLELVKKKPVLVRTFSVWLFCGLWWWCGGGKVWILRKWKIYLISSGSLACLYK